MVHPQQARTCQEIEATRLWKRIRKAREILTGRSDDLVLQVWFRREVEKETGWSPSNATLHRWYHGEKPMTARGTRTIAALESQARAALTERLEALFG